MPGQGGIPGGCTAVLLRRKQTHTHLSATPAGESCPQTNSKAGEPPAQTQRHAYNRATRGSLKKRAGEGLPQHLRGSITAPRCSFYVLCIPGHAVKTEMEQTWNLTGSHICRVAQSDARRCPDIEQKPLFRNVNCCLFHTPVHKTACVYPKAAPSGGTPRCAPAPASPQSHQRSG